MSEGVLLTAAVVVREARGLVVTGWSQGAQARDGMGDEVAAWSEDARSWSVLGALLASWHHHNFEGLDADVVAHLADARALGDATAALGEVLGTASLGQWNDQPGRSQAEAIAAFDSALLLLADD